MSKRKFENMPVINPYAAAIDVGSKSHFVVVGQDKLRDVCEFGVCSKDQEHIVSYLSGHNMTSVVMESTGSYWQALFHALQSAGFEGLLVWGYQTRNVSAKTEVKDCLWMQTLHILGLLRGCFLPDVHTTKMRTLHRHRSSLIEDAAKMSNKMQKALGLMNLRLNVVINDITGKTGMAIIDAIPKGEREGHVLTQLADPGVRRSKEEIAEALQGHWEKERLYELKDYFASYHMLRHKIQSCEDRLEELLEAFTEDVFPDPQIRLISKQNKGKNQIGFHLSQLSYKFYGVDLLAIDSIASSTVWTLICEIGQGIYKFPTAKHFASFLRLAPNNRISGGKVISSRTPKGSNKLTLALRNAANTIERKKEGTLTRFFKRIAYKKGRGAAITATARKLAVIIWNMMVKKEPYLPIDNQMVRQKTTLKKQKINVPEGLNTLFPYPNLIIEQFHNAEW